MLIALIVLDVTGWYILDQEGRRHSCSLAGIITGSQSEYKILRKCLDRSGTATCFNTAQTSVPKELVRVF